MKIKRLMCSMNLAASLFSLICAVVVGEGHAHAEVPPRPPNIVFVLADDLGWTELGCYGNTFNETRHLDRLASQGMRFTQAYAAAPVCSPFRAAFLTGQHPARIGITDYLRPNSANALSTEHETLPERLQAAGYVTGMIGKWHLSGYALNEAEYEITPADHGFDWDFARERKGVANGVNFWPYLDRHLKTRWLDISERRLGEDEFLVDRMNLEAVEFIERHQDRPFFLYLSHYAPHSIVNGKPELVDKYSAKHPPGEGSKTRCVLCSQAGKEGCPQHHWATDHNPHLAAMLESIDDGIGLITRKIEQLGLTDNTIVIFTSDNGGESNVTSNFPLRGGKSQLYEGGIRVPMIVRWPTEVPASSVCDQSFTNLDFYPTLLDAADLEPSPSQPLDGISTLATWKDPSATVKREDLYWHYPLDRPHFLGGVSGGAIRSGDWKLIEFFDEDKYELYSLNEDPSEQSNVALQNPTVVNDLKKKLLAWRDRVSARIPSPPMLTEMRQLKFADHFSSQRASERWFFNKDWSVEEGVLKRSETGESTTRIFLRDTEYQDVVIRFDFQLGEANDVRLMTGCDGHYNAVIHIRPDHFFVQTAADQSGPYFSYRHGECAFNFDSSQWYTMTVEIIGDQLVAHLDHEHLVYAKHPILNKQRTYFALQVDEQAAMFDNIQLIRAAEHPKQNQNLAQIKNATGRYPVKKTLAEQYGIQKRNAHERFYQRDEAYRKLVKQVDSIDVQSKKLFPDVFRTHKEYQTRAAMRRKELLANDPVYKELLFATHRAERAITTWLIQQQPETGQLPDSRRKRELDRLREQFHESDEYLQLVANVETAQDKLQTAYPRLFITNDEINEIRAKQRDAVTDNREFQDLVKARSEAYHAQQDYLLENDSELASLQARLAENQE